MVRSTKRQGGCAPEDAAPAVRIHPAEHDEALRWPRIEEEEIEAVAALMRKGELSISEETKTFEREFAEYIGVAHALGHTNGTAAIHAGLFGLGVRPGDEVIVPSYTYWASAMPIFWLGAMPVFCDIDPENLGASAEEISRLITPRTRAVVVVHLWGLPAGIDAIVDVCRARGVRVFEDASHAHGASVGGRKVGSWGDAAAFSLQSSKTCPAGEGGLLVSGDRSVIDRAVLLGHYERVKTLPENLAKYARTGFGFKYRMSPLAAAIGRRQLARLDAMNARRIANCERLAGRLRPLGFETYDSTGERRRIYYEFVARLGPELARRTTVDALVERLRAEGARVNPGRYPLLHQQPFFTEKRMLEDDFPWRPQGLEPSQVDFSRPLPESEKVVSELISIPTFPGGSFELVDQYARAFEKVMEAI